METKETVQANGIFIRETKGRESWETGPGESIPEGGGEEKLEKKRRQRPFFLGGRARGHEAASRRGRSPLAEPVLASPQGANWASPGWGRSAEVSGGARTRTRAPEARPRPRPPPANLLAPRPVSRALRARLATPPPRYVPRPRATAAAARGKRVT